MKFKIHLISIVGFLLGLFILVIGTVKYYIIQNEIYRPLVCISIGGLVFILSYVYNWMKNKDAQIDLINERLDAFATWWVGAEKETIEGIARGENNG